MPATHEILNDIDGDVVNFFRCLRERRLELERACRLSPYASEEYRAVVHAADADVEDLERARRWWVRSSQGFGGIAKEGTGWSTSIERGSNNARSVWNRLDRFAAAAQRLGTVTIENRDALEVIARYDRPDGLIYCDSPYFGETRTSIAGGRHGDYPHEFHTRADHVALARVLTVAKATVLISGYPSALYDDLYHGWWRTERSVTVRAGTSSAGARVATEAV